jgi:hypothetical protein
MNNSTEPDVYLDFYSGEDMQVVWCWKKDTTFEVSQEFSSEEEAMEAWKNDELTWSHLSDLGE